MRPLALILALASLLVVSGAAVADQVYLAADFDDKAIDEPIGTGGAEVGEPIVVDPDITATVRSSPFDTPSLGIQDIDDYTAGTVQFEFLGSAEITTDLVVISARVQVPEFVEGGNFAIAVREQGSAAHAFSDIQLVEGGVVGGSDAAGGLGQIGTYQAGVTLHIMIVHHLDAGTYDVWLDGAKVLDGRAHGITERGIGGVYFGCLSDPSTGDLFFVDDISVTDFMPTPVVPETWGSLKQIFRQ